MSKHQEILDYLEQLAVGRRISVRSISNRLHVSSGTAYRAIKEAEKRGLVETRPRSGTVRIPERSPLDQQLTYEQILGICQAELVAGKAGLKDSFSHFAIGAMTLEHIGKYLSDDGLLIVGDREAVQDYALERGNAVLVTGGFAVSSQIKEKADALGIPVMVSHEDTFTVARMITNAFSDMRIKMDIKTVAELFRPVEITGALEVTDTIDTYYQLVKKTGRVRFPILNQQGEVKGVISMRDVAGRRSDTPLRQVMSFPLTVTSELSLATVSQKMLANDFQMLPVVSENGKILGTITKQDVLQALKDQQNQAVSPFSEEMLAHLREQGEGYNLTVVPSMVDRTGTLSQGILAEYVKEMTLHVLSRHYQNNIIIEQMMLYFLQAIQLDDELWFQPKLLTETRKSASLEIEVYRKENLVFKAMITASVNEI